MYIKFKKGKQKGLVIKAIQKVGSERKLARSIDISKGCVYFYKTEKRNFSKVKLNRLLKLLDIDIDYIKCDIEEFLPKNWGRKKGGERLIELKKRDGTLQETIKRINVASSKIMKRWHATMKKEKPEEYYKWQYERFKKIGRGYTIKTKKGIKVRNKLEQEIADFLYDNKINFEYEPYLSLDGKAYFPDFIIKNLIVEATEWKHPQKRRLSYLKRKFDSYEKAGFRACLYVPLKYRKFYKEFDNFTISTLYELNRLIMPL